ncbi:isoprenylcysteine carboxyl methyltransferase family protein [Mycobacterium xenopi 3993]|nr:isoprenylcysteine carboxyl methyltransferase family protein [Mycobacterium xenopi 3993]
MFGLLLFLAAGTFDYWQAWVFLAVYALLTWIPGIYLLRTNPAALQRRMRGGPAAEIRKMQKAVMGGLWLSLAALLIVSTLGHRFGWALVPTPICLLGDLFVAVGLGVAILVIIQNNYAAATVRVEANQKLISTGLYGFVRHPMYTGNVVVMIGIPLALGSYWGSSLFYLAYLHWSCESAMKRNCSAMSSMVTLSTPRKFAIAWCQVCGEHLSWATKGSYWS